MLQPRANTFWFRDWFYPLWKDHGGVQVRDNYFRLLARHFRKNGVNYGAGMNFGEYVHFMSGAAGLDLKAQATHGVRLARVAAGRVCEGAARLPRGDVLSASAPQELEFLG